MHADRAADRLAMPAAKPVGPWDIELDLFFEGGVRQLGGDAADGGSRDAGFLRHARGGVFGVEKPRSKQLEYRHRLAPIGQSADARESRRAVGGERANNFAGARVVDEWVAIFVAREQAVFASAGSADHQPGRI